MEANLAAIRLAHRLRDERRPATEAELPTLAAWSSWGAVPGVFDEANTEWASQRAELHELLPAEREWEAAARTTINAHYTDPRIVADMWQLASGLGLSDGQVLEPGCGSGTFIGMAPAGMSMVGVELDPTTAAIAAGLYPDATVRAESFADSRFPAGSFDAAVGNVPFGDVRLYDRAHNQHNHSIHNHFLIKSVDLVRPGGIVVALTSRYTLDGTNPAARREMFDKADLIGAIRLPTGAHRRTAGTDAVTDIVVLRRRQAGEQRGDETWLSTSERTIDNEQVRINRYFQSHPEAVLGDASVGHGMYGAQTLTITGDLDLLPSRLSAAIDTLTESANRAGLTVTERAPATPAVAAAAPDVSHTIGEVSGNPIDGFTRLSMDGPTELNLGGQNRHELAALLALRDDGHRLLRMEAASVDDTPQIDALRGRLADAYADYLETYGPINRYRLSVTKRINTETGEHVVQRLTSPAVQALRTDPLASLVKALEDFDEPSGIAVPAAMLRERVVVARTPPLGVDTADEAVAVALDTDGEITLGRVGTLLGVDEQEARAKLGELVYTVPGSRQLVPRAEYLSGNVRDKLDVAQQAVTAGHDEYQINVDALTKALPRSLGPSEITAQIGAVWISPADHQLFIRELLRDRHVTVAYGGAAAWEVRGGNHGLAATVEWGTADKPAGKLYSAALNQRSVKVESTDPDGKSVVNPTATEAAKEKAEAIAERFADWVWDDPARADRLTTEYNRRFNSIVLRDYSAEGQHLSLPGLAAAMTPRPHQRAAVARMLAEPAVGLFHDVGAGKTGEMVMGAMELRRLGLASKPVVVVPNHMLEQFSREWVQWYPQARVLAASTNDLAGNRRRDFVARVATGDWDGIVMTRGAFSKLAVSPPAEADYMRRELASLREQLELAKGNGAGQTVKQIERKLLGDEEKLKKKLDQPRDPGLMFEDTGIDYVIADEAHEYKNLTTVSKIPGASISKGSDRATDLHMKLDLLRQKQGRRVATLATATPIANSVTEAHVMLRYLRPDLLAAAGIEPFDSWAATFGKTVTELELDTVGRYRQNTRFASFQNVPELLRMWWVPGDVKTAEDLQLPTPELARQENGQRGPETVAVPPTPELLEYVQHLGRRADSIGGGRAEKGADNPLTIAGDGRKAALDLRLVGIPPPEGVPQKLDIVADRIHRIWTETKDNQYTDGTGQLSMLPGGLQLVFCDLATPKNDEWNAYDEIKNQLATKGMDPGSIRFIHEAKNDSDKARLFAECRSGQVAVLIGSTRKMGIGTNVQNRAVALHHVDAPWKPSDVHQRDGRILRQGNQNDEVQVIRYVTGKSFDAYTWQTLERKAKFIGQVLGGSLDVREMDDVGTAALSLAETKALAADDPLLLEKATVDAKLGKYVRLERAYQREQSMLSWRAEQYSAAIICANDDEPLLQDAVAGIVDTKGDAFRARINGADYTGRAQAANALRDAVFGSGRYLLPKVALNVDVALGGHDFTIVPRDKDLFDITITGVPRSEAPASVDTFKDGIGGIRTLENRVAKLPQTLAELRSGRAATQQKETDIRAKLGLPFRHADELTALQRQVSDIAHRMAEQANNRPTQQEPDGEQGTEAPSPGPERPHDSAASPAPEQGPHDAAQVGELVTEAAPVVAGEPASSGHISSEAQDGPVIKHGLAGTIITGTSRADEQLRRELKQTGFNWSSRQGFWYLRRDQTAQQRDQKVTELMGRMSQHGRRLPIQPHPEDPQPETPSPPTPSRTEVSRTAVPPVRRTTRPEHSTPQQNEHGQSDWYTRQRLAQNTGQHGNSRG